VASVGTTIPIRRAPRPAATLAGWPRSSAPAAPSAARSCCADAGRTSDA